MCTYILCPYFNNSLYVHKFSGAGKIVQDLEMGAGDPGVPPPGVLCQGVLSVVPRAHSFGDFLMTWPFYMSLGSEFTGRKLRAGQMNFV